MAQPLPSVLLVMGVAGAGKSTHAEALAAEFGWPFRDADSFHPAENIAKMSAGTPLGRVARPQEMADAILYLASPRSTYITGAALLADGGMAAGSTNLDQKAS